MKIQIDKGDLLKGIQTVQNTISSKISLPILNNILIETQGKNLRFIGTDLDVGISCLAPVNILSEGAITLPAKKIGDIIRELPNGEVTVIVKKNNMVDIESGSCRFKLMGLPKDEFPKLPEFKDKESIKIPREDLKEMLNLTSFAVSHEETRYILNGILLEVKNGVLRLVATDGRRLALAEKKIDAKKEISVILPIKAVQELVRNIVDEGPLSLVVSGTQALFEMDDFLMVSRLIEGEFPNYNQVIPEATENKIKVGRGEFLAAIKRANLLSTQDSQAVKFEIFKNRVVVSKVTPDLGESREDVGVEYSGKEFFVGFNPHYLIDVLKNLNQETIELEVTEADKPGVVRAPGYLYLVLPMRL